MDMDSSFYFMDLYGITIKSRDTNCISVVDPARKTALTMDMGKNRTIVGSTKELIVFRSTNDYKCTLFIHCRKTLKLLKTLLGPQRVSVEVTDSFESKLYIMRKTSKTTCIVTRLLDDTSEKFVWAGVDTCPNDSHGCLIMPNSYSIQLLCLNRSCELLTTTDLKTNKVIHKEFCRNSDVSQGPLRNGLGGLIIELQSGDSLVICHKTGRPMFRGAVIKLSKDYLLVANRTGGISCYKRGDIKAGQPSLCRVRDIPKGKVGTSIYMGPSGLLPNASLNVRQAKVSYTIMPLEDNPGKGTARKFGLTRGKYLMGPDGRTIIGYLFDPDMNSCYLAFCSLKKDYETIKKFLFGD